MSDELAPVWHQMGTKRYWKELVGIDRVEDEELRGRIEALDQQELFDFYWTTQNQAGRLLRGGATDPRIANWIVRQGLRVWEDHRDDPGSFPGELPETAGLTDLSALAAGLYRQRHGAAIDEIDPRKDH